MIKNNLKTSKGIIVSVFPKNNSNANIDEILDELEFLASTLDIKIEKKIIQRLDMPDSRTYVGKGKLEEIDIFIKNEDIELVIFETELSPSQMRNLENILKVKIYDRNLLILDIFLKRAKSAQAKTQVNLARYQYLLPRLTKMWTHLERQRGGTGTRGGAGEKEIETDRRTIRTKISLLKQELIDLEKQAAQRRKSRSNIVRVALVGYTNAGKSSLMNLLSKENLYVKNELFATLDATVRKVVINQIPFLLSDTVGFIRKLPHNLIESFKTTLEEAREADILLHVVDVSNPAYEDHIKVVEETLEEINAHHIKTITVYNKCDMLSEEDFATLPKANKENSNVFISTLTKFQINEFKEILEKEILAKHLKIYPNYLDVK